MRCDDLTRELSAPTGQIDPAELANHLAACPRCAAWSKQSARFDEIWEATRPQPPSTAAWDRVWANVSSALDRAEEHEPAAIAPASPRWRRVALAVFTVAQAAAVLAAFGLAWRESGQNPRRPPAHLPALVPLAVVVPTRYDIPAGEVPLIDLDRKEVRLLDQARVESTNTVDRFYSMFNEIESLAVLQ